MAKPSQAHEQTMEEILASIRRMIADDRPPGERPPRPPAAGPSGADNVSPLFAAARDEAAAAEAAGDDGPDMPGEDALRIQVGEVGDRLRAEPVLDAVATGPDSGNVVELAMAEAIVEARADLHAGGQPAPKVEAERPRSRLSEPVVSRPSGAGASAPRPAEARRREVAMPALARAKPEERGSGEPLLSPLSGAAVAGAFEQLAQSMLSGNHRTVAGMVEDLLRPMLRDWLDDNLPPLVERLVREEIERVSRGRR